MFLSRKHALLTASEMHSADLAAVNLGISSVDLMETAGAAVSDEIRLCYTRRPVVVLCGPGNNGGDGFVIARRLKTAGWPVKVALLCDKRKLFGDAKKMASLWEGPIALMESSVVEGAGLIVDAIFGAGLKRDISGKARSALEAADAASAPIVAVDLPSGVNGDSGIIMGFAPNADLCVTFMNKKLGHTLLPGKSFCGETRIVNIGIPDSVFCSISAKTWENHPRLWSGDLRWPVAHNHKYDRGYTLVNSGDLTKTGAGRLAALAALRVGSGLVGVACSPDSRMTFAIDSAATILHPVRNLDNFSEVLSDRRITAVLLGPGNGINELTKNCVLLVRKLGKTCVLDADALTVFDDNTELLFRSVDINCILTPHDGEFARIFPGLSGNRLERARAAAKRCGGIVVLKGSDTVVASPDGRSVINTSAPATLATAGSGDVLAGIAVGLLAQGMPAFEAACAAVWIHGHTASRFPAGLIADDLIGAIPDVVGRLIEYTQ